MYAKRCRPVFFAERTIPRHLPQLVTRHHERLERVYQHQFNKELFQGTLPSKIFGDYLRDDYYYLQRFARVIHQIANKALPTHPNVSGHLLYLANDIINNELHMQKQYSEHLQDLRQFKPSIPISAYVDFIEHQAYKASLPVAFASIFPCFWIYSELGKKHKLVDIKDNPYKRWIDTYSGKEFVEATHTLAETLNPLQMQLSACEQKEMEAAFLAAIEHEYCFFEMVYPSQQVYTLPALQGLGRGFTRNL